MKILFSTDQIHLHGGIEKVLTIKANYWANQPDTEVIILTTEQRNQPPCYPLDPRVKLVDLAVDYDRAKSYFSLGNLGKARKHYFAQKKMLRKLKPDVVISPNYNFDHYWLPFISGKTPTIKERHGSRYFEEALRQSPSFLQKLRFAIQDWADARYTRIVVLNADEQSWVKSPNAVVIPNPVDALPAGFGAAREKTVLAAGRISPVKGFDQLIRIWGRVAADFPEWKLHFYGQDYLSTKNDLQTLVHELNVQDSVEFKDSVSDLYQVMGASGIYAMTSETECFPMVLLEALSAGLPVITHDCPTGPRHIVTDSSDSFLIPYKDLNIFADKLKLMMADEDLRKEMGKNAVKNVERFSIEKVMKKWEQVFEELTPDRS